MSVEGGDFVCFKEETAIEVLRSLGGPERCIRGRLPAGNAGECLVEGNSARRT